jgi:hypothetical protein
MPIEAPASLNWPKSSNGPLRNKCPACANPRRWRALRMATRRRLPHSNVSRADAEGSVPLIRPVRLFVQRQKRLANVGSEPLEHNELLFSEICS